jgi:hypothetical protein
MNKRQAKKLRNAINTVANSLNSYIKAANAVIDQEYGEGVQRLAASAADTLVDTGWVDPSAKERVVQALVHNKEAGLKNLINLSRRAPYSKVASLGTPEKAAGYEEEPMKESDKVWRRKLGI